MMEKTEQALGLLRERFPKTEVTSVRTVPGMRVPMLQLLLEAASLRHELGSRWRLAETWQLCWYPAEEKELPAGAEPLLLAARELWPRAELKVSRDGNLLRLEAETEQICFLTGEEAEKMKRELLTLQLKWQEQEKG